MLTNSLCSRVVLAQLVAGLAMLGCATQVVEKEKPASASNTGEVAGIMLVRDPGQGVGNKVVVASFLFSAGQVQAREAIVAFGPGKLARSDGSDFKLQLTDFQDRPLAEIGIVSPRKAVVEQQGVTESPEAVYAVRFPFQATAKAIRVLDPQGNVLATADIGAVIREFCANKRGDKDCSNVPRAP
ncbi:MAG: hypothetical protein ACR2G6_15395 [Gemmatimonadaceae bacterium]